MFDLLKFCLLAAGCAAVYGLATGADLNELFSEIIDKALPAIQSLFSGLWDLIRSAIAQK